MNFKFDRFLRTILASRFLTVSALIHLLIIVLFGGKVIFDRVTEPPDFTSAGDEGVAADVPPAPEDKPADNLPPPPAPAAPPPSAPQPAANLTAITSIATGPSAFSMPLPAIAPPTIGKTLGNAPVQSFNTGPAVQLTGVLAGRTGNGRGRAGQQYGQKAPSEEAVMRALRWLQAKQNADGTWGSNGVHGAFSGLGLLCFLGHGETPATSREFGVVVTNAINALVAEGTKDQGHLNFQGPNFSSQNAAYQHAIATYALCEAYTMTKDERLVPIINQAIDYIIKGQRPDGGWAYKYSLDVDVPAKPPNSDTSVCGWQIQALKAAHLTGIPDMDAKVHPVLDSAMKNLDRVYNPKDGSYGYRKAGDRPYSLAGVGALAKLFWLGRPDKQVREALKMIQSKDLDYGGAEANLYAWYYDSQACYQAQGGAWDWWKGRFQEQLDGRQAPDGSWPPAGGKEVGGYAQKETDDGGIYRTTLCCLMLEVFYRYLPTSKDTALGGSNVQGL